MTQYTLLKGTHGRFEGKKGEGRMVIYKAGDVIDLTDEEAVGTLRDRIGPVASSALTVGRWDAVLEGNVASVVAVVKDLDATTDVASLGAAEEASQGRKGVLRAVKARAAELDADGWE